MLQGGVAFNKDFVERMLDGIQSSNPDETILNQYGVTLTNYDLSTLKQGRLPTLSLQNWAIRYYRNVAEQNKTMPFTKGILVLDPLDLHDIIKGNSAALSDIRVDKWKMQTVTYTGRGKTIFNEFGKILAPIRMTPEHTILVEIRNGTLANTMASRSGIVRAGYPEIVVYDSFQREYRHFHNSLYMIMKRFVYEELLERSGNPQAECYQDSLMYSFRRGNSVQVVPNAFTGKDANFDSVMVFVKNLQILVNGGDVDSSLVTAKDIDNARLELFNLIISRTH
jgi:hypothetical protein